FMSLVLFSPLRPPPASTLFPYTTLFRSFGCIGIIQPQPKVHVHIPHLILCSVIPGQKHKGIVLINSKREDVLCARRKLCGSGHHRFKREDYRYKRVGFVFSVKVEAFKNRKRNCGFRSARADREVLIVTLDLKVTNV